MRWGLNFLLNVFSFELLWYSVIISIFGFFDKNLLVNVNLIFDFVLVIIVILCFVIFYYLFI